MKKTMFITSVIMVVVMAIALTTSSLAWFSAAGSQTVTTNAMTLQAKATSAQGLIISVGSKDGAWLEAVDLIDGNAVGNMYPSMPYKANSSDELVDALAATQFISNTVDMNGNYSTANPEISGTTTQTLYFAKDLWIASVDTTNDLVVTPSIAWKAKNATTQLYTDAYTYSSSHPIVNVAILADKNEIVKANRSTGDTTRDWEIVALFSSAGTGNTIKINFGGAEELFQTVDAEDPAEVADSFTQNALVTAATYDSLAKITTNGDGEMQPYGEVKQFKVIAWYDGIALINGNSTFTVGFELTFTAATAA